ncbi:MAG: YggS family pyridoxal phosphate-dependent enzyme [Actinobacteria bacterium]|nr:YggS family pyridoxal phosphate-dependent enzyme [Actinomycetota bacterium]
MATADRPSLSAADVGARAEHVRDRIRSAGGDPAAITLVAVTKAFDLSVLRAALDSGLHDIGENYAQELVGKAEAMSAAERDVARFHFVGRLQRNKVRGLAPFVRLWHTVDRPDLGAEIARRLPGAAVLVQINASAEAQKGGCAPAAVGTLVDELRGLGLDVRGLMTLGVAGDLAATARAFAEVSTLADRLDLTERSMGMSADLETAVREGATMVRIGRDLFGPRPGMRREQEERLK